MKVYFFIFHDDDDADVDDGAQMKFSWIVTSVCWGVRERESKRDVVARFAPARGSKPSSFYNACAKAETYFPLE